MRRFHRNIILVSVFGVAGCADPDPIEGSGAEATGTETCFLGSEGCNCAIEGVCDPGLECHSGLCVDPGRQDDETSTSVGDTSSDDEGGSGGTGGGSANEMSDWTSGGMTTGGSTWTGGTYSSNSYSTNNTNTTNNNTSTNNTETTANSTTATSGNLTTTNNNQTTTNQTNNSTTSEVVMTTGGTTTVAPPVECSIDLTSVDALISAPSDGWGVGTNNFTLEFWIKLHGGAPSEGTIIGMNEDYTVNDIMTFMSADYRVVCNTYSGMCPCGPGSGNAHASSDPINDGEWHHIACVRDGATLTAYTDGEAGEQDLITTTLLSLSNVSIGRKTAKNSVLANLGPIRFSSVARYNGSFAPETGWNIDGNTVSQYLTSVGFNGTTLVDEAGGNNNGIHDKDVVSSMDCP